MTVHERDGATELAVVREPTDRSARVRALTAREWAGGTIMADAILGLRAVWAPYSAILGRVPGMPGWHDVERYPGTSQVPGLLIIRWSAPLFFANANQFRDRIRAAVRNADPPPRWVLIAAEPISDIDITASEMLVDLDAELMAAGIFLAFAEVQSAVRDWIVRYEILDMSHGTRSFASVKEAVDAFNRDAAGRAHTPDTDAAEPDVDSRPHT